MKKYFLSAVMAMFAVVAMAQVNVQLHYDLGRTLNPNSESDRPNVTTTVEMFHPDATGSTYFFVDMDYFSDGVGAAYWEISREFKFKELQSSNFAAHIEYDGGLKSNKYTGFSSRYQQCFLLGAAWNWHNENFAKTFSLQAMYKHYLKQGSLKSVPGFQLTGVWGTTFAKGLCTFSGFADLWYGYTPRFDNKGAQKKGLVFITEPQFWFNIVNKDKQHGKFSLGTEWEFSNDFIWPTEGKRTFFFNPTIAAQYVF